MKEGLKNFALNYRDEVLLLFGSIIMIGTILIFILAIVGMHIPPFVQEHIRTLFTVGFSSIAGSSILGMFHEKAKKNGTRQALDRSI